MSFRRCLECVVLFIPSAVWYGCIAFLSHQPKLPGPGDQGVYDFVWFKTGHVLAYTILLFLLFYAVLKTIKLCKSTFTRNQAFLLSLGVLIVLAVIDEIHQSFIPGRNARASDVLIDTLGSGAVLLLLERYNAFLPHNQGKRKK